ncbi:MAG: hypothetical protein H6642_16345 [Caldilineaceae bacterium]|nr:hypothetical protein [Caldilineaceae bacterium]
MNFIVAVLSLFAIALVMMAVLAPLESLGWWAGWFPSPSADRHGLSLDPVTGPLSSDSRFVVFLTGIGSMKAEVHIPEERVFLDHLIVRLPQIEIVDDIYPYSVTNTALTGNRIFSAFWRLVFRGKEARRPWGLIGNVRNMFQVMVSSDHRYGVMYDRGTTEIVLHGLARHGYPFGSGTPVYLLGYSGGGQIAMGCASLVAEKLNAPVRIISLAGVFCSDPGQVDVEHIYHIHGSRDKVERLGRIIFPGRWPIMKNSFWNQAREEDRVTIIHMGDMTHNGPGSYLDADTTVDGVHSYLDKTVEKIAGIVTETGASLPPIPEQA